MNQTYKLQRERLMQRARAGQMRCDCGAASVNFKHGAAVCARCDAIENRLHWQYGKNRSGQPTTGASTDYYNVGRI